MPKYVIFLIILDRKPASESGPSTTTEDPELEALRAAFIDWLSGELKEERLKGGDFLEASDENTNIRVDFHGGGIDEGDEGREESGTVEITRGHQPDTSTNILGWFTAEFDNIDGVEAWAKSCPLAYEGFALEIREVTEPAKSMQEAPTEVREMIGNHIVEMRRKMLAEGKLRWDEDGTLWAKIEDDGPTRELLQEAEARKEARGEIIKNSKDGE